MNEFEKVEWIRHDIASCEAWIKDKQDSIKQLESQIECIRGRICELENALKDAERNLHRREHVAYLYAKLDNGMTKEPI